MTTTTLTEGQRAALAADRLAGAVAEFTAVVASGDGGDPWLVDQLRLACEASGRLRAAGAVLTARLEGSGRWRGGGARSLNRFLTHCLGILPGTAQRMAELGRALTGDLPATARAVLAGHISVDHAELTARHALATEVRKEALAREVEVQIEIPAGAADGCAGPGGCAGSSRRDLVMGVEEEPQWWAGIGLDSGGPGEQATAGGLDGHAVTVAMRGEEHLVVLAGQFRAEEYRRLVTRWAARNDPESIEDSYRAAEGKEHVLLAKTWGGWHLEGFLTDTTGQLLKAALDAVHQPPARGDLRTGGQRRAADLAALSHLVLDRGLAGTSAGASSHIGVMVAFGTLQRLATATGDDGLDVRAMAGTEPASWADGTGPLPHTLLAQLACTSTMARYVFGPGSQLINLGQESRLFSRAQRRALAFRDGQCTWPGCAAGASWCDGHHALPFEQGGPTDVANGALLCPFHHRLFHSLGITMRRHKGRWRFYRRSGQEITGEDPAAA